MVRNIWLEKQKAEMRSMRAEKNWSGWHRIRNDHVRRELDIAESLNDMISGTKLIGNYMWTELGFQENSEESS